MIRFLRQHQTTLGRGFLSLLLSVWLSLALTPCVMAMTAADDVTSHHSMESAGEQKGCHACHGDCQDEKSCARNIDLPLNAQAATVAPSEVGFILLPPLALPGLPVPEPPQLLSRYYPPDTASPEQHPSLKFRVLRI